MGRNDNRSRPGRRPFVTGGADVGVRPLETGVFPDRGRIVVLDALRLLPAATLLSDKADLIVLPFAGLSPGHITAAAPDLVAAPLIGSGYDILDVLTLLADSGYAGPVAALTRPFTVPGDLIAAIASRARGRGLTVSVVEVGRAGDLVAVTHVAIGSG
jgi:hypothetical protein